MAPTVINGRQIAKEIKTALAKDVQHLIKKYWSHH